MAEVPSSNFDPIKRQLEAFDSGVEFEALSGAPMTNADLQNVISKMHDLLKLRLIPYTGSGAQAQEAHAPYTFVRNGYNFLVTLRKVILTIQVHKDALDRERRAEGDKTAEQVIETLEAALKQIEKQVDAKARELLELELRKEDLGEDERQQLSFLEGAIARDAVPPTELKEQSIHAREYEVWNGMAERIVGSYIKPDWIAIEAEGLSFVPAAGSEFIPPADGSLVDAAEFAKLYQVRLQNLVPYLRPETLQSYFDEGRLVEILLAVSRHHPSHQEEDDVDQKYKVETARFYKDMEKVKAQVEAVSEITDPSEVQRQLDHFKLYFSDDIWKQLQGCGLEEKKTALKFCYVEFYIRNGTEQNPHRLSYVEGDHFGSVMLDGTGDCNAFAAYYLSVISALRDPGLTNAIRISNPKGHVQLGFWTENLQFIKNTSSVSSFDGEYLKFRSLSETLEETDLFSWNESDFTKDLIEIVGSEFREIDLDWDVWKDLTEAQKAYCRYIYLRAFVLNPESPTAFRNASFFIFDELGSNQFEADELAQLEATIREMSQLDFSMSLAMSNYLTGAFATLPREARQRISASHNVFFARPEVIQRLTAIVRSGMDTEKGQGYYLDARWYNTYAALDTIGGYNKDSVKEILSNLIGSGEGDTAKRRQRQENLIYVAGTLWRIPKPWIITLATDYKWLGDDFDYTRKDKVWDQLQIDFSTVFERVDRLKEMDEFLDELEDLNPKALPSDLDLRTIRAKIETYKASLDSDNYKYESGLRERFDKLPAEITTTPIAVPVPASLTQERVVIQDTGSFETGTLEAVEAVPGRHWVGHLESNGGREVAIMVPPSTDISQPVEVVYYFHGLRANIEACLNGSGEGDGFGEHLEAFSQESKKNVVFVLPRGFNSEETYRRWMNPANGESMKDFQDEVEEVIQSRFGSRIDIRERIMIAHSAGGHALMAGAESGKMRADGMIFLDASYGTWAQRAFSAQKRVNENVNMGIICIPNSDTTQYASTFPVVPLQTSIKHGQIPADFFKGSLVLGALDPAVRPPVMPAALPPRVKFLSRKQE